MARLKMQTFSTHLTNASSSCGFQQMCRLTAEVDRVEEPHLALTWSQDGRDAGVACNLIEAKLTIDTNFKEPI